ncbi:FAD-dependent oxidoreductase [Rhodococcus sp. NPDC058532]|uniref:FAD-dependent oxidoreductase n=1 Tax=Rhodococcus sp. NPDC058532 TaxID=3346540 RepID=UPI0036544148
MAQTSTHPGADASGTDPAPETCDACIVGAGIAGMNALFAASRYLSHDARVILIDRRGQAGGMWVDTYPYVRLHQPHGLFTAGNIEWCLDRRPSHLATKTEVLDHFRHCLDVIGRDLRVDEYFGWSFESATEANGTVRIQCHRPDGRRLVVHAQRLIKAYGLGIAPNDPLPASSSRVRSVSPDQCDVRAGEIRASDAPVWVIGGGKTAMDTAHALVTADPRREVTLVAGSGTFFISRDRAFPGNSRRWWRGQLPNAVAAEAARRFDGTNEAAVARWYRATHGTGPTPGASNFLLGVQSEAETSAITAGVHEVVMDHFVDAVDRGGGPTAVFRSGATKPMTAGTWIVNCTGYIKVDGDYEPYVSPTGNVVVVHPRSAVLHLPSFMGYYLAHLMFAGRIRDVPLYELDVGGLFAGGGKHVFPYTAMALAMYNLGMLADALPATVFRDCGLDFDRWYPIHRRLLGTARFAAANHRDRAHHRRTLDTVRERFDVRGGPLVGG